MNPSRLGRWRKLYCSPSSSWLTLSYSARGLGYELLRVCDDEGRIECGKLDPFEAVLRLCAIGPRDRKGARLDFEALLVDGFVGIDGTTLVVRNFAEAQGAKSDVAVRKERERHRAKAAGGSILGRSSVDPRHKVGASSVDPRSILVTPSDLTPREDSTDPVTCHGHSEKRREEIETDSENRVVELHSTPPPEGVVAEAPASLSEPCATAQLDTPVVAPRCDAEPPEQPSATPAAERPVAPAAGAPAQPVLSLVAALPAPPSEAEQLFEHWRRTLEHPRAQLDAKRRRTIERALKSHGLAVCLAAIDGCARSDWHRGANPEGKRYDDIELILRDASKIERFAAQPTSKPAPTAASGVFRPPQRGRAPMPTQADFERNAQQCEDEDDATVFRRILAK